MSHGAKIHTMFHWSVVWPPVHFSRKKASELNKFRTNAERYFLVAEKGPGMPFQSVPSGKHWWSHVLVCPGQSKILQKCPSSWKRPFLNRERPKLIFVYNHNVEFAILIFQQLESKKLITSTNIQCRPKLQHNVNLRVWVYILQ